MAKVIAIFITCPRCKGKGRHAENINWFFAVFTLGITALMQLSNLEKCELCKGTGRVKRNG